MSLSNELIEKASKLEKTIALPESTEPRILSALNIMLEKTNLKFVLFGNEAEIKEKVEHFDESRITIKNVEQCRQESKYIDALVERRKNKGMTAELAVEALKSPMTLAAIMEELGEIDGIVCGVITHTADVLRAVFQIIKTKPNVSVASSCVIFDIDKSHQYGKNGPIIFADCSVIPHPTSENLKDIAIASVETHKKLIGGEANVAFLSFSSKSGDNEKDESIVKVKEAARLTKLACPELNVDGELQLDCALDAGVAKIKAPNSPVAGKANILIFPDLDSANIGYKLVSRFAGIPAIGVILQGVNKPVNDLSRGAEIDEICSMIAITALS